LRAFPSSLSLSSDTLQLPHRSLSPTEVEISERIPPLTVTAIISFYPVVDIRIPRSVKKSTNPQPALNRPDTFTDLFDASYMTAGLTTVPLDYSDPYLSPAAAPDVLLAAAYPVSIVLYTCEYDMLNAEGVSARDSRGKG
jgi:putative ergosteryl-3beta-O-L-aspartate hydrolase